MTIPGRSYTFLHIDDNNLDLLITSRFLQHAKLAETVHTYTSANLTLQHIREEHFDELPIIILLDIQMPELNGFDFLDRFAELPPAVTSRYHIYMLSSTLDPKDRTRVQEHPFVIDLLTKPLDTDLLRTLLEKLPD